MLVLLAVNFYIQQTEFLIIIIFKPTSTKPQAEKLD